ncbi:ABC-type nitrate/sulfonate/bicarbonate transport system, ATPase component [Moraxella cuniculi DSM 21768]|uniref:ABC-type nitrate/sulfonate/bicarbonate transport system, ATPase component n=1 Tax=Moraxella cuniculi DSM 21768 TaxID=1122245 RepID=A0A1N7EPQ6_9GAMM|nr:ATP-binding cassette domain-containing protein [Moraxella cuniculi]OOS07768.1 nitrate ABC transporter ATP-binding protein [Moraxella cuniculi]SIR90019.1 ABC-type nitrate/sulfonate/bicarbonate transport system, ATPase component [Moraxella cuniculi DSM 21768]
MSADTVAKLQLIDIHHDFVSKNQRLPLFDGINLTVDTAKVVAIIGASGVGKTTLFNIAAGILSPKSGQVRINGADCTGVAGNVGYMLQKDLLLPFKRVYDNIALPLVLKNTPKAQIEAAIYPRLALFGLEKLAMNYPHQLSGGQRQRAALLRTYLSNNELMLLDEPFSALDFVTKTEMYAWFHNFQKTQNLTCLIITHDIDEAILLADEIYVLKGMPAKFTHHFLVPQQAEFQQSVAYLSLKQAILSAICQ